MVHEIHETHEMPLRGDISAQARRDLPFGREVYEIQGAIFDVYRELGAGFLEAVYQECLGLEFAARGVPFEERPTLSLSYKGSQIRQRYVPDFICFRAVVVELKALGEVAAEHRAQILNYLKASGLRVGLLVNFGCAPKARVYRFVL